jgi:hypothetical protein
MADEVKQAEPAKTLTLEDARALIRAEQQEEERKDSEFLQAINAVCEKYGRTLAPSRPNLMVIRTGAPPANGTGAPR